MCLGTFASICTDLFMYILYTCTYIVLYTYLFKLNDPNSTISASRGALQNKKYYTYRKLNK